MGSKGRLTHYEKLEALTEALQDEVPGIVLPVNTMRKIIAKTFGHVSRQAYYNNLEGMEIIGGVEPIEGEGVLILPRTQDLPNDFNAPVLEASP